jgi:putative aldouronate transport system permease protein
MVAPTMVLLLVFYYVPLLANVIAFEDYSPFTGVLQSSFVGLGNFSRMFGDPAIWSALRNTLLLSAAQLVLFFPVPILLALLLDSLLSPAVKGAVQSILYIPHFLSWVIVIIVFQEMLGDAGLVNQILRLHGFAPVGVMTNPAIFWFVVTAQVVWKEAGWGTIIFLAALGAIDGVLYEAATVDGAGRLRRLWHVTLPGIRPVIVLLLILRLGDVLTVGFEQIILQRDAVGSGAAEVLDTFVYYTGVQNGDWSYAAAAGLVKGLLGICLILIANRGAHALGEQGVYSRA